MPALTATPQCCPRRKAVDGYPRILPGSAAEVGGSNPAASASLTSSAFENGRRIGCARVLVRAGHRLNPSHAHLAARLVRRLPSRACDCDTATVPRIGLGTEDVDERLAHGEVWNESPAVREVDNRLPLAPRGVAVADPLLCDASDDALVRARPTWTQLRSSGVRPVVKAATRRHTPEWWVMDMRRYLRRWLNDPNLESLGLASGQPLR